MFCSLLPEIMVIYLDNVMACLVLIPRKLHNTYFSSLYTNKGRYCSGNSYWRIPVTFAYDLGVHCHPLFFFVANNQRERDRGNRNRQVHVSIYCSHLLLPCLLCQHRLLPHQHSSPSASLKVLDWRCWLAQLKRNTAIAQFGICRLVNVPQFNIAVFFFLFFFFFRTGRFSIVVPIIRKNFLGA